MYFIHFMIGGTSGYIKVPFWSEHLPFKLFDTRGDAMLPSATCMLLGGVLVGFGTRLGNGCSSGHGVCGIPRLSKRSFTAVCVFMATGMATATTVAKRNCEYLIEMYRIPESGNPANFQIRNPVRNPEKFCRIYRTFSCEKMFPRGKF